MDHPNLIQKAQELTDIELATLLSLTANQHCIIQTEEDALDALQEELQLIASNVFGLSAAVVQCSESTTLDDFSSGVLVRGKQPAEGEESYAADWGKLIRTNRIFTHTAVYTAPKPFLIIALTAALSRSLVKHLNDHMFLSHYHSPEDGFANLEEGSEWVEDERASISSVVHRSVMKGSLREPVVSKEDIHLLSKLSTAVTTTAEVKRYLQNIITFLRVHRAVVPGSISPRATQHFDLLIKCLAPLHSLTFTTPSIVALAARKIYRHRITITAPEDERSMQYGSNITAVRTLLEGVDPEGVIAEVLASVEAPL
ncbi:hypothetical protein MMC24_003981 [Lignoscripta atroalba]|nr:hypothetical protein [Lignoscripta atroalba]